MANIFTQGLKNEKIILLVALGIEITWRITGEQPVLKMLGDAHTLIFPWVIRVIYFIALGWLLSKNTLCSSKQAAMIGLYRGVALGIVIGLFELVWYHNINAFIFLLALPWQTLAAGYVLVGVTSYIISLWKQERKDYLKINK